MIDKNIEINGQKIYLKHLTEENATDEYCSWINDIEVNIYLESKQIKIEELRDYIKKRIDDPNCIFLGIFLSSNQTHIGNIKLEPIDFKLKIATLGILIGDKEYWGKGLATEALKMVIKYSFAKLKLKEINLGVYKNNIGAIKAYKKSGFYISQEDEKAFLMKVTPKSFSNISD